MPTVSMFYGIIIRMNPDEHNPPHFHVLYSGQEAVFDFDGNLTGGSLPRRQLRLVQAWCTLHKEELEANWELLMNNEHPYKIEPLR